MRKITINRKMLHLAAASCAIGPFLSAPASAQSASAVSEVSSDGQFAGEEEIIVTAERRESTVQNTALSIAALSGEALRERQVTNAETLMQSLTNVQFAVNKVQPKIAIRGVGLQNISISGPESRIAFHLDGIYLARPESVLGAFFDIQRIEVVRGPQGILYGRNATGGAINLITTDPTDALNGYFNVGIGNYEAVTAEGAIGGPLSEKISARLAFRFEDNEGYGRNIITGKHLDQSKPRAVRGKVKVAPSEDLSVIASVDYARQKARTGAYYLFGLYNPNAVLAGTRLGGAATAAPRRVAADYDPHIDNERYGFGLDIHGTLGSIDVRAITGYRELNDDNTNGDVDFSSLPLSFSILFARSRQFTQEVRFSQKVGRLEWLLGGYFFNERLRSANAQGLSAALFSPTAPILPVRQGSVGGGIQHTRAYAIFGQVRYEIADNLTLSLGGRFGWEKSKVNETVYLDLVNPYFGPYTIATDPIPPAATGARRQAASRSDNSFTPKMGLEYRPRNNFLLYATYSKGFKSGGFNLGAVQPSFAPEKLTSYEVGLKASWLDKRLQTNVTGFHYDYANLQVTTLVTTNNIVANITTNAGRAKIDGVEVELVGRPVDPIRLELNYAYLDARYTRYFAPNTNVNPSLLLDLSGKRLTQAPKNSLSVAAEYSLETAIGEFKLRGEGRWVSRTFYSPFNELSLSTPSNDQYNAFLTYSSQSRNWTASAYVRNIGNKTVGRPNVVYPGFLGGPIAGTFEPPRLYGVSVGYRF